jgi:hypothetical protein
MTWKELADDHRDTAQHLIKSDDARLSRGVCNRAYCAAYAMVTAHLPEGITFGRGWRNPEHARLPAHVSQIGGLSEDCRRAIRRALRRLRQRREDSDYRPGITVDMRTARESLRDAGTVFLLLERS